jgi:hypothetical protein
MQQERGELIRGQFHFRQIVLTQPPFYFSRGNAPEKFRHAHLDRHLPIAELLFFFTSLRKRWTVAWGS